MTLERPKLIGHMTELDEYQMQSTTQQSPEKIYEVGRSNATIRTICAGLGWLNTPDASAVVPPTAIVISRYRQSHHKN